MSTHRQREREPRVPTPEAGAPAPQVVDRRREDYLPRHRPGRLPIAAREVVVDATMLAAAAAVSAIAAHAAGADVSVGWLVAFSVASLAFWR